ncbi:MAG: carbon-nitrogen hydrolase family protein [Thermoflexales bacterium]|nr:carbon-nitrogen hydrolase family protein [Thermoflexales bacterium]
MANITVAAVQMDPKIGQVGDNRAIILDLLDKAVGLGAQLIVFPEAALSGYCLDTLDEARAAAEPVPGPSVQAFAQACRAKGVYAVIGMLEDAGERLYNSAVLVGPHGLIGCYRKSHLPFLGVDRLADPGDSGLQVYDTELGRLGLLVCYDLRFPEAARCLALNGADIIALPTNWPEGAESAPDFIAPTRALENRVFVITCDRCGHERGFDFIGKSVILDPAGGRLAQAGLGEEIITATFDPGLARQKRLVIRPGEFELDTVGGRRPELYARLVSGAIDSPRV